MDFDPEIVDRMKELDPARLLPFERRFEPELPPKQRLPRAYRGSMNNTMFDTQVVISRHP